MSGFEVIEPGLLTTVQDRGRVGYAHIGVPRSGALDQGAWALANRLVGNTDAAALEITLTGCVLRAVGTQVVAVTGAFADIEVDERPMAWGSRVVVPDGAELRIAAAQYGARSIIAIAGGVDVEPVLGSRSRDTLSGIGPTPLVAGDLVRAGSAQGLVADAEAVFVAPPKRIRLMPGPDHARCDATRLAATWRVTGDSNRVGVRLEGEAIERAEGEIRSFPMITGAVQLPPSGQPIILLADHATTGGYPVVAVVAPDDLDACAQWRPGDEVTTYWG